ncbi:hypothetical protein BSZ35_08175 [Salinibacter sp. 10B]|nr:hypothetical protein BSZ35_08175 [Salinibacter sp. 10B]
MLGDVRSPIEIASPFNTAPNIRIYSMSSRNLVLAYIEDYSAHDIAPFVDTLRATGYDGDVVFFTSNIDPDCAPLFRTHQIHEIPVTRVDLKGSYSLDGRLTRALGLNDVSFIPDISINRRLSKGIAALNLGDTAAARLAAQYLWHCQSARFIYFFSYLKRHPGYDTVLLTDVRDVVFQDNPFSASVDDALHVFEEYGGTLLGNQINNAKWIDNLYGADALEELAAFPIICCGVTLGSTSAMVEYLRLMCHDIVTRYSGWGTDQGIHNYLVRKERLQNVTVHPFGNGAAMHVGIAPRSAIATDAEARVLTEDGTVCPIIHQYDRHEDLRRSLPSLYDDRPTAPVPEQSS